MKTLPMVGIMIGATLLCAAPISAHWSPAKTLRLSLDSARGSNRTAPHAVQCRGRPPENV